MNSNEKLERELESFLREDNSRIAVLYRKLPRPEPDARIDAQVLAGARRAAGTSNSRRPRRWLPAMSAAAAVLLAASVAIRVAPQIWNSHAPATTGERDERAIATPLNKTNSMTLPAAPEAAAKAPSPQFEAAARPEVSAAQSPATMSATARPKPVRKSAPAIVTLSAPQAAPPPTPDEASAEHGDLTHKDAGKPTSAPMRERAQAFPARPAGSRSDEPPKQYVGPATEKQKLRHADSTSSGSAAGAAAARANSPAFAGSIAPLDEAKRAGTPAAAARDRLIRNSHLYPESWIAAIRQLIETGHDDEARENLHYFRKKYPDYHLPDDLTRFAERGK